MSQLKSETARLNGAKSRGPVTAEGKARSSQNARKHGLTSKMVVLPHEDQEAFEDLRQSYLNRFRPIDHLEAGLVDKLAALTWRQNRMVEVETNVLIMHTIIKDEVRSYEIENSSPEEDLAWTVDHLANNSKTLQLLLRYDAQFSREFARVLKQLQDLQKNRPALQPPVLQNEPKSDPIYPDPPSSEPIGDPISAPEPRLSPQPGDLPDENGGSDTL